MMITSDVFMLQQRGGNQRATAWERGGWCTCAAKDLLSPKDQPQLQLIKLRPKPFDKIFHRLFNDRPTRGAVRHGGGVRLPDAVAGGALLCSELQEAALF
jgi:hypothetical protein